MAATAKDPVCGMNVDPGAATQQSEYQGNISYFCSPGCKRTFDQHPEQYVR